MLLGLVLGLVFGIIPAVLIGCIIYDRLYKYDWIGCLIGILIEIVFIFIGSFIGIQVDNAEYNKKIANWQNTKTTLEKAIRDESISDLSKIELVNKAITYNMQLVSLKEDIKHWWYFYLDDEKVNKLELIDITSKKEDDK